MAYTYVFTRGYDRCILTQLAEGSKIRCACPRCLTYVRLAVVWAWAPQAGKDGILIWAEPQGLAPYGETPFLTPAIEKLFLQCWTSERPRSIDCDFGEQQEDLIEPAKGTRAGDGRLTE